MHPNPIYRSTDHAKDIAFARSRGFGVLSVNGAEVPLVSHVPFVLSKDGSQAELHLVRSNPMARQVSGTAPARLAVTGSDGYVSPDWYGIEHQVPTWNYVAVHLTGTLERLPDDALLPMLDRLSDFFEARLAPKPVWKTAKMPAEALERMLRMIVPYRLTIGAIDATWKLSQNKPDAARLGAADGLDAAGIGAETAVLAALMRNPPAL